MLNNVCGQTRTHRATGRLRAGVYSARSPRAPSDPDDGVLRGRDAVGRGDRQALPTCLADDDEALASSGIGGVAPARAKGADTAIPDRNPSLGTRSRLARVVLKIPEVTSLEKNMPEKKKARATATEKQNGPKPEDVPSLFRINVEVGNLSEAAEFYGKLFGLAGRLQAGSRCYFTCGAVTLQVVDVSSDRKPHPAAKALYFVVNDLDAVFERAR